MVTPPSDNGWFEPAPTPPPGRHPGGSGHTGRGNAAPKTAWPQPIACVEVFAPSRRTPVPPGQALLLPVRRAQIARRGGWTGRSRSCPDAYPRHKRDQSPGPSLPARSSRRSAVLRPRRTPAGLPRISPSAYTSGLCRTSASQTGLSPSTPNHAHVPLPIPRRDPPSCPRNEARRTWPSP
jgi:hypothetical protein